MIASNTVSFANVWNQLIEFVKKPRLNPLPDSLLTIPQKVFPYLLAIDFLLMIPVLALISLTGIEGEQHETMNLLDNPVNLFFLAVVLAPIAEELVFRFPIGEWWEKADFFRFDLSEASIVEWWKQNFRPIFWSFTLFFAFLHFSNFTSNVPFYFAPILVLPQFILGIILGFIRVGWGTRYSILFHAIHNGMLLLPLVLGGASLSS